MFNLGTGCVGFVAQAIDINGNVAPAIDVIAHAQNFGFHDGTAPFLRTEIGTRQEYLTDRDQFVFAGFVTCATNLVIEKRNRDLHMDARAITGFAIGVNRATVPNRL